MRLKWTTEPSLAKRIFRTWMEYFSGTTRTGIVQWCSNPVAVLPRIFSFILPPPVMPITKGRHGCNLHNDLSPVMQNRFQNDKLRTGFRRRSFRCWLVCFSIESELAFNSSGSNDDFQRQCFERIRNVVYIKQMYNGIVCFSQIHPQN